MYDAKNSFDLPISLAPAARTASANGTGVDIANCDRVALVVIAGARTDGSHAFTVEESADNSTFSAVAAGDLDGSLPTVAGTGANAVYRIGYKGTKRYLRAVATVTGATTGAVYGATIFRGAQRKNPVP